MIRFAISFFCMLMLLTSPARAEVGNTDIIDAIATKPNSSRAVLLLHQSRPWSEAALTLLEKKLNFYWAVISSGHLAAQRPETQGKSFRIVVIYLERPSSRAEDFLAKAQSSLKNHGVGMVWGTPDQAPALSDAP